MNMHGHAQCVVKTVFWIASCAGRVLVLTAEDVAVVSRLVVLALMMLRDCVAVVFVLE